MSKNFILFLIFMFVSVFSKADDDFGYTSKPNCDMSKPVVPFSGSFEVGALGSASYTIPIEIPAGVNGTQPNISINYDSQSGNGLVGYGCSIGGFSSISRSSTNIYYDDESKGLMFKNGNAYGEVFSLDGQRLIYSGAGNLYYLPNDKSTKIYKDVILRDGPNLGEYLNYKKECYKWVVHYSDGSVAIYGSTPNSTVSFTGEYGFADESVSWNVCYLKDKFDNWVKFTYHDDRKYQSRPWYVEYGNRYQQPGSKEVNKIEFDYETRNDVSYFWINRTKACADQRLKSITVKTNGKVLRKYVMAYTETDDIMIPFSRLKSVTKVNGSNEESNPISFDWNILKSSSVRVTTPDLMLEREIVNWTETETGRGNRLLYCKRTFGRGEDHTFYSVDLNGDGVSDIVEIAPSETKKVYHYDGSDGGRSFNSVVLLHGSTILIYRSLVDKQTKKVLYMSPIEARCDINSKSDDRDYDVNVFDINGDGYQDMVFFCRHKESSKAVIKVLYGGNMIFSNGSAEVVDYAGVDLDEKCKSYLWSSADFNNDGHGQIAILNQEKLGLGNCYKLRLLGNFKEKKKQKTEGRTVPDYNYEAQMLLSEEVCLKWSDPRSVITHDFNADGLTDIMVLFDKGYQILYYSGYKISGDGSHYEGFNAGTSGETMKFHRNMCEGDFDGDGCLDFVYRDNGKNWYVAYGKTDGTFEVVHALKDFGYADESYTERDNEAVVMSYDMNNDGKTDLFINMRLYANGGNWGDWVKTTSYWLKSTGKKVENQIFVSERSRDSEIKDDRLVGHYTCGDYDGDGKVELLNYGYNCYTGENDRGLHIYDTEYQSGDGKVRKITDALGNETCIKYESFVNSNVYSKGSESEFPMNDAVVPIEAVSTVSVSNGSSSAQTTEYRYKGLKFHLQGLGSLGLEETVSYNPSLKTTVRSRVEKWDENYFVPVQTKTITETVSGNTTFIQSSESFVKIVPLDGKRYVSYPNYKIDTDMYGHETRTDYVYDESKGVPLSEKVVIDGDESAYKEVRYSDYIQIAGNYYPQYVSSITKNSDDQDEFVTTTKYEYLEYDENGNSDGVLLTQIGRYGTSKPLTTKYTYDKCGNVLTTTIYGNDIDSVKSVNEFDATKRFVVKTYTEPASVTKEYTYDDFGRCLTSTEYAHVDNKHTTTYEYDSWGNCIRTVNPNGTVDVVQNGYDSNKKMYDVFEQGTGKPWTWCRYDISGRKVAAETISMNDVHVRELTKYDERGNVIQVDKIVGTLLPDDLEASCDANVGESHVREKYTYDVLGRVTSYERLVADTLAQIESVVNGANRDEIRMNLGVKLKAMDLDLDKPYNPEEPCEPIVPIEPVEPIKPIDFDITPIKDAKEFRIVKQVSYEYGDGWEIVKTDGKEFRKDYDLWGNLIESSDPKSQVIYFNNSNGNPYLIDASGDETNIEYDDVGNRIAIETSDAGRITYEYNTKGDLVQSVNAKGVETSVKYDKYGRVKEKTIGDTKLRYNYFSSSSVNNGLVSSVAKYVKGTTIASKHFSYDKLGRIIVTRIYNRKNDKSATIRYAYDSIGQLSTITYPNNVKVDYEYDCYGNKKRILVNGKEAYKITNSTGREFDALFSEKIKIKEKYDAAGHYSSKKVTDEDDNLLLSLRYRYDDKTDNMIFRSGMMDDIDETFEYDELDRLTSYIGIDGKKKKVQYNENGNITFKTGLGAFDYASSAHPHRLTDVENEEENISKMTRNITYNEFNLVSLIEDATEQYSMSFDYGVDNERMASVLKKNGTVVRTTYCFDNYEQVTENGKTTYYYYLGDNLIYIKQNGVGKLYLACGDHLGSIVRVFDEDANVVFKAKYDAWGVQECEINSISLRRGYTGQEEMPEFGLVNLNARLYDPMLGRFISPDNFVQCPDFSQNYNRYAYCINNPLKFSDPSGNLFGLDDIVVAMAISAAINAISTAVAGGSVKDVMKSFAIGAFEGAVTFGIGSAFQSAKTMNWALKCVLKSACHGVVGGAMSVMQGGNFKDAFLSSTLSGVAGGFASKGIGALKLDKTLGLICEHASAALVGGGTALSTGHNFWGGCARALVISVLNDGFHKDKPWMRWKGGVTEDGLACVIGYTVQMTDGEAIWSSCAIFASETAAKYIERGKNVGTPDKPDSKASKGLNAVLFGVSANGAVVDGAIAASYGNKIKGAYRVRARKLHILELKGGCASVTKAMSAIGKANVAISGVSTFVSVCNDGFTTSNILGIGATVTGGLAIVAAPCPPAAIALDVISLGLSAASMYYDK